MGRSWIGARRRDPYYRRAKAEGYRSRAAYKLQQIDDRFHVLRPRGVFVDLGAAPGGWSQVARERGGPDAVVLAVDRARMRPLEGVTLLQGDLEEARTVARLRERLPDGADAVLSDMAPKLSGTHSLDHARSVALAEAAVSLAREVLRPGGNLVVKILQGEDYDAFLRGAGRGFRTCHGFTPSASLPQSAELYVVGLRWEGRQRP